MPSEENGGHEERGLHLVVQQERQGSQHWKIEGSRKDSDYFRKKKYN